MSPMNPPSRYAASLRWLHWTIFALVLLAYVFINLFELFPRGSTPRLNTLAAHYLAGIAVYACSFIKLIISNFCIGFCIFKIDTGL